MGDGIPRCGWETGTVGTGPSTCGRPAKYRTTRYVVNNRGGRDVCDTHARKARSWGDEPVSLEDSDA